MIPVGVATLLFFSLQIDFLHGEVDDLINYDRMNA